MIKMSQKYSQDEAQALVKALKEGNQLAFSIVYKTYAAQTFSLAFKYLLNKELAEDALEQLSPQRRKVFEMKVSGKYSNQEIADKLNLSINTIKFQYSQSLKQIRATVG